MSSCASFTDDCSSRALARLNPLLNVMLAFWALWHCRHARPRRRG